MNFINSYFAFIYTLQICIFIQMYIFRGSLLDEMWKFKWKRACDIQVKYILTDLLKLIAICEKIPAETLCEIICKMGFLEVSIVILFLMWGFLKCMAWLKCLEQMPVPWKQKYHSTGDYHLEWGITVFQNAVSQHLKGTASTVWYNISTKLILKVSH